MVQNALNAYDPACLQQVKAGMDAVTAAVQTSVGAASMHDKFKLCDNLDPNNALDMSNFFATLAGNFQGIVQYSQDNRVLRNFSNWLKTFPHFYSNSLGGFRGYFNYSERLRLNDLWEPGPRRPIGCGKRPPVDYLRADLFGFFVFENDQPYPRYFVGCKRQFPPMDVANLHRIRLLSNLRFAESTVRERLRFEVDLIF